MPAQFYDDHEKVSSVDQVGDPDNSDLTQSPAFESTNAEAQPSPTGTD